ncbi:autotransporter-associated beta strand repeat-containing protein [Bombella mellum]|uniref:autotransporter-associated beta strand repeat-containing protein n=1 Tax=Bombella mellum TaxID=2039288 RepID=UPI0015F48408|nr:autotransporter-associated beta strand repeat-containing protein [Bombella mellum]
MFITEQNGHAPLRYLASHKAGYRRFGYMLALLSGVSLVAGVGSTARADDGASVSGDMTNTQTRNLPQGTKIDGNLYQQGGDLGLDGTTVAGTLHLDGGTALFGHSGGGHGGTLVQSLAGNGDVRLDKPESDPSETMTPSPNPSAPYQGELAISQGKGETYSGSLKGTGVFTLLDGAQTLTGQNQINGTVDIHNGTLTLKDKGSFSTEPGSTTGPLVVGLAQGDQGHLVMDGPDAKIQRMSVFVGNGDSSYGGKGGPVGTSDATLTNGAQINNRTNENMYVVVANGQHGSMNVESGSRVASDEFYVAASPSLTGTVNVKGSNSAVEATNAHIGAEGTGTVNVSDGGSLQATSMTLGEQKGEGTVTVGANGTLKNDTTTIGADGKGTLTVNGGRFESDKAIRFGTSNSDNAHSDGTLNVQNGGVLVAADNGSSPAISAESGAKAAINIDSSKVQNLQGHDMTSTVAANLTGSNELDVQGQNTMSWKGGVSGSGDLVKVGTGTLELAGGGTYSGQTDVQSGVLNVGDVTMGGPIRNRKDATFTQTGGVVSGDLDNSGSATVNRTNVTGTITNNGDFTSQSSQLADLENISGTATLKNTLALNITTMEDAELNLQDSVVRAFHNMDSFVDIANSKVNGVSSPADTKSDEDVLAGRSGISLYALADRIGDADTISNRDDAGSGQVTFSTNSGRTRFRGSSVGGVINTGTLQLLQKSTGGTIIQNDGKLLIDDSTVAKLEANGGLFDIGNGGATVWTLKGGGNGQLEGTLNLTNAADTYSGSMSGTGGLTISGGTETLAGQNTYTGDTNVAQGAGLVLTGSLASPLNNNGTATVDGGKVGGLTTNVSELTVKNGGALADLANKSGGTATLTDSTAGHVINDEGATFSATGGQLASAENSGTMTLGKGNSVTGDVTQKAGSLTLDGNQIDGILTAEGGQLTVAQGGSKAGSLAGSSSAQLDGSLELTKASTSYDGVLGGQGGLTVSGGTQTLTGNNTYTGDTNVTKDGGLVLKGSLVGALNNDGRSDIDGGRLAAPTTNRGTLTAEKGTLADLANRAGTATLTDSTAGHVINEDGATFSVTGGQLASAENSGTMTLGKDNSVTGDVTQKAGSLTLDGNQIDGKLAADGGQFTVAEAGSRVGTLSGSGNGQLDGQFDLTNAADTYSGVLSGKGGLTVSAGHESLTGASTYTGDTNVAQKAGLTLNGAVGGALNNDGTTDVDGGRVAGLTTNSGTLTAGKATLADVVNKAGTATLADSTAGHVTNADGATFSATGGQLASAENSGTMTLGKDNSVTGDVIQKAGSLTLDHDEIGGILTAEGGQLTVAQGGSKAGSLAGSSSAQLDGSLELTKASTSYDGVLGGQGGLTVSGGTQTLTGNNTYTGDTNVTKDGGLVLKGSLVGALNNDGRSDIDGGRLAAPTTNRGTLTAEKGTLADLANRAGTATLTDSTAGHVINEDGATFSVTGGQLASAENSGTMTLGKDNSVTGDVTQKAGSLTLDGNQIDGKLAADGGQFTVAEAGSRVGTLSGSGNGQLDGQFDLTNAADTYSGVLSGKGGLTVSAGHESLTGASTYTGDTNVAQKAGLTLNGAVGGALNNDGTTDVDGGRVAGLTTNRGTLNAEKATLADVVNKAGTATLADSTAGHVTNADGATFSATGGQLASAENSGIMTLGKDNSVTGDVIQKAGSLTLDGNRVDGTLAAGGGTFTVTGNGSTVGSLAGIGSALLNRDGDEADQADGTANGTLNGTLHLTNARDTYAGNLSGTGGLTVSGGHEVLTGTNSYAGPTLVQNDARLDVNGDNGAATGATSVVDSATLRGKGTIGGDVTIGSGATLAPGTDEAPGRLQINGNLNLDNGSRQVFRLGQTNTEGGAYNDFVDVKGSLQLGGTLSIQPVEGAPNVSNSALMSGLYRLYSYGGTLSGSQQQLQLPGQNVDGLSIQTSIDHQVNLTVPSPTVPPTHTDHPDANFNFWDGNASSHRGTDDAGNGKIDGGDGVWSAASPNGTPNWAESDGKTNGQWQSGNMAIFAASAGTVRVDDRDGQAPVSFSGAQFANIDGKQYLVTGDRLEASTGDTVIRVGDGTSEGKNITAEIASVIDGSHVDGGTALHKADLGTLILSSDNDFARPTRIDAGTLQLGNGGTTGSVGSQEIINNGTLAVDHSNDITLAQPISGTGSLVQKGSGTTTLSGDNTYAGDTKVDDGRLNITGTIAGNLNNNATTDVNGGRVGGTTTNTGTLTAENGTLAHLDNSGKATLTGGQLASATNSGAMTLGQGNTVTGDVTQNGGTLSLDGNKVDGTLAANGGQFDVTGNGSTVGSLTGAGNGVLDGTLSLTNAHDTYAGSLSGTGGLTLASGQETLTNQSHIGGPVAVNEGTLALAGSAAQLATDGGMTVGSKGPSEVTLSDGAGLHSSSPIVFAKAETMPADGLNATINVLNGSTLAAGDANGRPGLDAEDGARARLVLDGGTLQNQKGSDLTGNVDTSIGSKGATFDVQDQNHLTLASNVALTDGNASGEKAGGLTKTGTGTFTFEGDGSGFSGPTDIQSGEMIVDGNLSRSDVTVQRGAGLAGNGYVGTTVVSDGAALGGGNEARIGGLHVNGDLTMAKGSVLFIRGDNEATGQKLAEPDGFSYSELKSDRVLVSGKATLQGGTLDLQVKNPMALSYGQAYRVLTANAGVNGHYDDLKTNIGQDYAYLDPRLVYQDNDVDVVLRRSIYGYDHVGQTRNEVTAGEGLNRIGDGTQLAQAMTVLTKDQARRALDNLSGELHASIRTGLIQDSFYIRNAALNRLAAADCDYGHNGQSFFDLKTHKKNGTCYSDHAIMWGQAYGGMGFNSGDGNAALMHHNTAGFVMGVDAPISRSNWRVGGLISYGHSQFNIQRGRSSSANSNNVSIGAYAGTHWGRLNLRLGAIYSWNVINTHRHIAVGDYGGRLSSSYLGGTAQGFGELGYKFRGAHSMFEPFMNVAYVNMESDSYREHGNEAALHSHGTDTGVTFSSFGFRTATTLSIGKAVFMPHLTAAYRHAFGRMGSRQHEAFSMTGGASDMDVAGVLLSSNAAVVQAGVTAHVSDRVDLDLSYIGQYGNQSTESGGTGSVKVRF